MLILVSCQSAEPTSGPPLPTQEELCKRFQRDPKTDPLCKSEDANVSQLLRDQFPEKTTTIDQVEATLRPYQITALTSDDGAALIEYAVGDGSWVDNCPIIAAFSFDKNGKLRGIEISDC
jgi:hypothetical protein